jgi:hypothetical protein
MNSNRTVCLCLTPIMFIIKFKLCKFFQIIPSHAVNLGQVALSFYNLSEQHIAAVHTVHMQYTLHTFLRAVAVGGHSTAWLNRELRMLHYTDGWTGGRVDGHLHDWSDGSRDQWYMERYILSDLLRAGRCVDRNTMEARFPHMFWPALGPTQLIWRGYRIIPGGKAWAGTWNWPPYPI